MALVGMVYSLHVDDVSQHVSALTYVGGALGVTFAGDFLSLYVFWELMAISSALLVWLRREPSAVAAGFRYLLVHVFGGLVLLAGIVIHWSQTGSLAFEDMGAFSGGLAWALILVAFLLNAAVPAAGRVASRRVSRGDRHRRGLYDRFHDQIGRLRFDPGLRGNGPADMVRGGNGGLWRRLCRA